MLRPAAFRGLINAHMHRESNGEAHTAHFLRVDDADALRVVARFAFA